MRKLISLTLTCLTLGAAVALVAAPAPSDQMMELAKSKQCLTCHEVSAELTAPSFEAIARQWKGVKNADIYLSVVIQKGGTQHFGCNMMPSQHARAKVSETDAMELATWILNMK
jgi:cytochrome c